MRISARVWLAVLFSCLFTGGCIRAKQERADLGPEFSAKQIDEALARGAPKDPGPVRVGQYINYSIQRQIENGASSMFIGSTDVSVVGADLTADGGTTRYTLKINKSFRQNDGRMQNVTSEDKILRTLKINSGQSLSQNLARAGAAADASPTRVSFHHLSESDSVLAPPDKVRMRPDCGGLSPCEMALHYVHFDLVNWQNDKDYQKITLDFAFSPHTPRLPFGNEFDRLAGTLVVDCRSLYVPVESRNVYVRDCQTLDDFEK